MTSDDDGTNTIANPKTYALTGNLSELKKLREALERAKDRK